jgi:hypothetical protein
LHSPFALIAGAKTGEEGACKIEVNEFRIADDRPQVLTVRGGEKTQ